MNNNSSQSAGISAPNHVMCPWETLSSALIAKRVFDNTISWAPGHRKEQNQVLYQHTVMLLADIPNETKSY